MSVENVNVSLLEEQGDCAADYLEEFLDIADFDGDIEIGVDHDRALVAIVSESKSELRPLVGQDGEVLEALQELTRLAVQTRVGQRSRLMLDIAGHRKAKKAELLNFANEVIEKVKESKEGVELKPMNAFERKIVHDAVTDAGLLSVSEGVEPNRFIKISVVAN